MTEIRLSILKAATAILLSGTAHGIAQTPAQPAAALSAAQAQPAQPALPKPLPSFYRNLIVIDPAHGGPDQGANLAGGAVEKDVTLAFAQRLRPALAAQGFTVVTTRDSDPSDVIASDQRAGTANHVRPLACLVLHATTTGSGIHIATSAIERATDATPRVLRWNDAQAGALDMSLRLANEIGLALSNAHLPVVLLRASVPPIDNLTCAASVVEIAPLAPAGGSPSPVNDAAYQQHVAEAIALGLASFRTHNAPAPTSVPVTQPTVPTRPAPVPAAEPEAPAATPAKPATTGSAAVKPASKQATTPVKPQTPTAQPAVKQGAPR